ncbi:hypothetical protein OOU_Y34scaffold00336g2 [Pyricularia oryzae Y34]|uniref:Uncharacterized protein n=2 Tax=Pyricularia oryzae TaxID=318829 RepID=A0AA97P341_PYRO3|nr:hypothetical protein OOU_Y34scaffold00336g2 [Pyricularia oryzae Y34]
MVNLGIFTDAAPQPASSMDRAELTPVALSLFGAPGAKGRLAV